MAHYNQNWDDLGRNIQDIVDRAVNSHDYQKLNQTIRQVVDRAVDVGSEAVRKAMDATNRPEAGPREPVVVKKNLPVLYGSTSGKTAKGILKIVGGGLLSSGSFVVLFSNLIFDLLVAGTRALTFPIAVALAGLGGGVWLISSGIRALGKVNRFKAYRKALGQKTHCTLEKLARSVGKSVKFVRRELLKMIDEGLFLEGHMDKEQTCLITSNETYQNFEQSRLQLEERQRQEAAAKAQKASATQDPRVQEVLNRGNAFIAQIRKCNDDIPGEEISAKIDRMENIVRRIFERAETNPEIIPDLKKLMDYYLPMTVKLLNAYADMDAQPVQGETIEGSKREIEATLDTLNLAFEKLLDSVFQDTAMDVSSDISVLKTLLAQEGLTEDELSKMKKQQNV
ncbi:MAG: 5-bromo-4-chloroindolyl phosphate hydrolysis family protein [Oscillospiraceae bacterium]|nr:5-bromo-4-chloroindolyl phosphate hydrolysis family protein [Oscillospiraceae bacterium]